MLGPFDIPITLYPLSLATLTVSDPTGKAADRQAAARFADAWDEFVLAVRRGQARGQDQRGALTLAQYYLLLPLARTAELTLGELAEQAGIAAPTATRIIDALETAGVVKRERPAANRRTVLVSLTSEGRRMLKRRHDQLARRRRALYERLDPAEREQAERLLRHLAELIGQL